LGGVVFPLMVNPVSAPPFSQLAEKLIKLDKKYQMVSGLINLINVNFT